MPRAFAIITPFQSLNPDAIITISGTPDRMQSYPFLVYQSCSFSLNEGATLQC